jgi:hypothetical protein
VRAGMMTDHESQNTGKKAFFMDSSIHGLPIHALFFVRNPHFAGKNFLLRVVARSWLTCPHAERP